MNKKLMRFAALLLAAAMLFSFSACRTNDDGSESSTDEPSVTDARNIHEESTDSAELTTDEPTTDSRTATRHGSIYGRPHAGSTARRDPDLLRSCK